MGFVVAETFHDPDGVTPVGFLVAGTQLETSAHPEWKKKYLTLLLLRLDSLDTCSLRWSK